MMCILENCIRLADFPEKSASFFTNQYGSYWSTRTLLCADLGGD